MLGAHAEGEALAVETRSIGPALIFERLWQELGIDRVLAALAGERRFGFSLERAVFVTVLHRLFAPGSDRAAEKWKASYAIAEADALELHHFYRAMGWLGEPIIAAEAHSASMPRTRKDLIEERLFDRRRDLFSALDIVFFDTTSIYFEGEGGETLGQYGHSKDHRPDLKQMVVGVVVDNQGRPIMSELWPGNTADVKSLVPIVDRLRGLLQGQRHVYRRRPRHDQPSDDRRHQSSAAGNTSSACACAASRRRTKKCWRAPDATRKSIRRATIRRQRPHSRSRRSGSRIAATSSV